MSTQTVAPAAGPSLFNPTIARITLRGLLGRKRSLLLIPLPLILVGLAVLTRIFDVPQDVATNGELIGLGISIVLPLTSLIIGTSVVGSEIDDGTIVHILTKPLPRRQIVLTKYVVAAVISAVVVAAPMLVAGALMVSVRMGVALAVACTIGAFVYSALFVMSSLLVKRSVLVGLAYVLLWEGLLGNLLDGTKVLSVQKYVTEFAATISGSPLLPAPMSLAVAIVMSAVFTVVGVLISIDRLRSFSLAGDTS
ncbi:MAG: ABC transporter permease subunit [Actinocatenispora sp.]